LFSAFTRSSLSGWSVAAGITTASVTAPLWRTMAVTAAIGSILLVIGLSFAILMAARIARAEALHGLLIDELNHRVKNTLATVQSVYGRPSAASPSPRRRATSWTRGSPHSDARTTS
jgi:hypothetical protein